MTVPRWLLALAVAVGLLAMHGITATTAAASSPCGTAVPHEHVDPGAASNPDDTLVATQLSGPTTMGGHAGALCLAVLVGGLVLGLVARHAGLRPQGTSSRPGTAVPASGGRAPPPDLLPLLCICRT